MIHTPCKKVTSTFSVLLGTGERSTIISVATDDPMLLGQGEKFHASKQRAVLHRCTPKDVNTTQDTLIGPPKREPFDGKQVQTGSAHDLDKISGLCYWTRQRSGCLLF